jgi:hypothetical protein
MKRAIAVLFLVAGACSPISEAPPVVLRASAPPTPAMVERLVEASRALGYAPILVQPARGRFAIRAQFTDEYGGYVIAVECFGDGSVRVSASGPRVELYRGVHYMPNELRDEIALLAQSLERALSQSGPPMAARPRREDSAALRL